MEIILSAMYYKGDGVAINYTEAADWARRAAEQGFPLAQENLAYMFEQGKGVPLDYVAAYAWYSAAAAGGRTGSAAQMKSLAKVMLREQVRLAEARELAWAAEHSKVGPWGNRDSGTLSLLAEK